MRIEVGEENGACNYLFAANNPLVFVDPTGLVEVVILPGMQNGAPAKYTDEFLSWQQRRAQNMPNVDVIYGSTVSETNEKLRAISKKEAITKLYILSHGSPGSIDLSAIAAPLDDASGDSHKANAKNIHLLFEGVVFNDAEVRMESCALLLGLDADLSILSQRGGENLFIVALVLTKA
ncbi:MAG: hypothetical protein ACI8W8_003646 [Rhodothermales bacterium]|jgi:hypothetical protein